MAKLTRTQAAQVQSAIRHLERARAYLFSDRVAVCRRLSAGPSTTLDYGRADGKGLTDICKEYGSDLTGLDMGLDALRRLLAGPVVPTEE